MNLSHSLSQSNAVVGYGSLLESLGNIVDPDSSNLYVGLTFTYPLGNTAAKSALAQARAVRDQALDQYRSTEVQISQEINNALATEKSGRLQVKLSEANLKQAHLAYEHAVQLYEIGRDSASTEEEDVAGGGARINDFTLLQRQQELFNAQLGYIDAIAAYQKARVRLLAAEGGLDKTYQALLPAMEVYAPAPVITMDQTP
jgi:outer membrane protein TolC